MTSKKLISDKCINALALTDVPNFREKFGIPTSVLVEKYNRYQAGEKDVNFLDPFYQLENIHILQTPAESILEICDLVHQFGLPSIPVVFCELESGNSFFDVDGLIPWYVMFIDPSEIKTVHELKEIYIRLCAKLVTQSQGAGAELSFSVLNNLYRTYVGMPISKKWYDYDSPFNEGASVKARKNLSQCIAKHVAQFKITPADAAMAVSGMGNQFFFEDPDPKMAFDIFKEILSSMPVQAN